MFHEKLLRVLATDLFVAHHDEIERMLHPNEKPRKCPPFNPEKNPFDNAFLVVAKAVLEKYSVTPKAELQ